MVHSTILGKASHVGQLTQRYDNQITPRDSHINGCSTRGHHVGNQNGFDSITNNSNSLCDGWPKSAKRSDLTVRNFQRGKILELPLITPDQITLLVLCQLDRTMEIFGQEYLRSFQMTPQNPSQSRDVGEGRAETEGEQ